MAETLNAGQAAVELKVQLIQMKFDVPGNAVPLDALGLSFIRLNEAAVILARLAIAGEATKLIPHDETLPEGDIRIRDEALDEVVETHTDPHLFALRVKMESPLELWGSFLKAPVKAGHALVHFLKFLIFHDEIQNRLAAQGALDWEKVNEARLQNVEQAIRIAKQLNPDAPVSPKTVEKLLELSRDIQKSPTLRLNDVSIHDEP